MALKFRHLNRVTVRDTVNVGTLAELEFGLLKKYGKDLKLNTREKMILLEMCIDTMEAMQDHMVLEVTVRSLCHSRSVTADYLKFAERFNMKKNILCIGDVGAVDAPWAQLIQPAVYLFQKEYNVMFIESPSLGTSPQRWLKYGPAVIRGALKYLKVPSINVFCMGSGGVLLHQLLADSPEVLGHSHVVFNLDMPAMVKTVPFEIVKVEEALRDNDIQLWCIYNDDESDDEDAPGSYSRSKEGPQKMFDAISKVQARLESERRRGNGSARNFDEVLFSDKMNLPNKTRHIEKVVVSKMPVIVFGDEVLDVIAHYLREFPSTTQDDVVNGLVKDMLDYFREDIQEEFDVPAVKNIEMGRTGQVRKDVASANRRRLDLVKESMSMLALGNSLKPEQSALPPAKIETLTLSKKKSNSKTSTRRRTSSNLAAVSEDGEKPLEDDDDEEDSFFFEDVSKENYRAQWAKIKSIAKAPETLALPPTSTLPSVSRPASQSSIRTAQTSSGSRCSSR
eukprot:TRINITY_DN3639_c0_g1_i1.p1 TRINITY_DN3639_c0_g1~~TRINITY_DN3639_c0_g1_i1.p1  ORF type:complete len:530 (+),score=96.07 TRINITY_DN3639_c0_g1_i1:69-1592(+)